MERLAVYCIKCQMWFDTEKGWQAKKGAPPFSIPLCPCCSAPLMQINYDEFIKNNQEQGRLEEVMTWEYPDGSFWKRDLGEQKEESDHFAIPIPKGYREIRGVDGVYVSDTEIVVTGVPDENDETHNCNVLGCSSVSHVLFRTALKGANG